MKYVIGVDEAGRGPLAGPVAVGVVMMPANFDVKKHFPGVNDSKQLSELQREELYELILSFARMSRIQFAVRFASAETIDSIGITKAVQRSIYSGVRALAPEPKGVEVLLDGLLHAPEEYKQETIVRGDESQPIISLASIVAKVRRDRLMKQLAKKYPEYALEVHKGYGTKKHRALIKQFGLSSIHRRTYCKAIDQFVKTEV